MRHFFSAARFALYVLLGAGLALRLWRGDLGTFQTPIITFVLIPLLDVLFGRSFFNPAPDDERALSQAWPYRALTWLSVPAMLGLLALSARAVAHAGWIAAIDATVSVGIFTGAVGIVVAHELVHRTEKIDRALGNTLLACVLYMHWGIEHVLGHHTWVATPRDPATSRRGESLYAFWPRTVIGTFLSAWRIESERLARKHASLLHNRVLHGIAIEGGCVIAMGALFGVRGVTFFIGQAFVAILLLETINYVEHYGLTRQQLRPGEYERVLPRHSWNASERFTNHFLFNLQRHSDHHANPTRRYQILRHMPQAPQLPTGYAAMVVLAAVPPLWFFVMDRRLGKDLVQTPRS